ncbi:putative splicing factor [Neoconidiobolus thromboides FSU 785]|nr:putative splicing factor [Neoconidiobolus thromboides FSU 785]
MPTTLPSNMTAEQVKNYLVFLRMEEIGAKLRSNDIIPPEEQRSPSPEPVYNSLGQRVNTRDVRYKKKLEEERHRLIEQAIKDNPDFKPPADYRRPSKLAEKYFIPAKEHPDINFIGLLIGPRGNTLKKMETETGCKISIRGKGSVKEGKRTDAGPIPGIDEELHCLITGDTEEKVQKALKMVKEIIAASAAVPEGQNELKRQQLRELASLNGTLRDDESMFCQNCGASGHRSFECPDTENFTVKLVCKICNGVGHTASDCMQRNDPEALEKARMRDMKLDTEYLKLMNELGEESQVKKENNMENNFFR